MQLSMSASFVDLSLMACRFVGLFLGYDSFEMIYHQCIILSLVDIYLNKHELSCIFIEFIVSLKIEN